MRALSAWELLHVWEMGQAQAPAQRALGLLASACPELSPEAVGELSIGQRDTRLLMLREWAFGPRLESLTTCPGCGARLELSFNVDDIRVPSEDTPTEPFSLSIADYQVEFRVPNSLDLVAVDGEENEDAVRQELLERCLLEIRQNGDEKPLDQLPAGVVDAVVERMARGDPQADVQLDLSCPECSHQWQATFDIMSFFWTEISAWASRILREVHTLASAYGWREADILALSPWRRQVYMEIVGG